MRITILGCGSSGGVPIINCDCAVCKSGVECNVRTRTSAIIDYKNTFILVDSGPDFRQQFLCYLKNIERTQKIDGVIFTHAHADHCHGIDDLRALNFSMDSLIDVYGHQDTLDEIKKRFYYVFPPLDAKLNHSRCSLNSHDRDYYKEYAIGEIKVQHLPQNHGNLESTGLLFNDELAYCTDMKSMPDEAVEILREKKLELLVLDCLRYMPHKSHMHWDACKDFISYVKPKKTVLTHMSHDIDYRAMKKLCADSDFDVEPGYDGLSIKID